MHRLYPAVLILGLLVVHPAQASEQNVFGAGAASCSEYLASTPGSAERNAAAQWTLGFMVGLVGRTTHTLPVEINLPNVLGYLQDACAANPTQTILAAAGVVVSAHKVAG